MDKIKSFDASLVTPPAWMQVKEGIVDVYFSTLRAQHTYRASRNPLDLYDFANKVMVLYTMVESDYEADPALQKSIPILKKMKRYAMHLPPAQALDPAEWGEFFEGVRDALYATGILRLTRERESDDELAGWES